MLANNVGRLMQLPFLASPGGKVQLLKGPPAQKRSGLDVARARIIGNDDPLGRDAALDKSNPAGSAPSANRRLPFPSVIGKISSRNSLTRSCFRSVWMRFRLPYTCISEPACSFSFLTSFATSPSVGLRIAPAKLCHASSKRRFSSRC